MVQHQQEVGQLTQHDTILVLTYFRTQEYPSAQQLSQTVLMDASSSMW